MNIRWLFRAARWAQHPPSAKRVKFVLAIVAVCAAVVAIEHYVGWPEALSMDPARGRWGMP